MELTVHFVIIAAGERKPVEFQGAFDLGKRARSARKQFPEISGGKRIDRHSPVRVSKKPIINASLVLQRQTIREKQACRAINSSEVPKFSIRKGDPAPPAQATASHRPNLRSDLQLLEFEFRDRRT